jgi:hypothetical protein
MRLNAIMMSFFTVGRPEGEWENGASKWGGQGGFAPAENGLLK